MPVPFHRLPDTRSATAPPRTRRSVLLGLATTALLAGTTTALTGCSVRWVTGAEASPAPRRGPDDEAREAAVTQTRDLLGLLLPAARGPAPLQIVAATAVEVCTAHLRALGEDTPTVTATVTATTTASPDEATGEATGEATDEATGDGAQPVDAQAVVDRLATAAGTALRAAGSTETVLGAGTARLLASIGAGRAVLLDEVVAATGAVAPVVDAPAGAEDTPGSPHSSGSAAGGSATPAARSTGTAALQAALAGEHAAVFAFGLVAGRLTPPRRAEAATDLAAHRVARDDLSDALVARGATGVQAQAGYDASAPTAEAATELAATVEDRLAGLYADLVAAAADDLRGLAVAALLTAARAAHRWGSPTTAFPGMAELAEDGGPAAVAPSTVTTTATVPAGS